MLLRRGDIALVEFDGSREGEARYVRPAIVVTNNQANAMAPVVVVIPLTSNVERIYPMNLFLPNHRTGLDRDSKAQVELIGHIHTSQIRKVIGHVPPDLMTQLDERIRSHLAL